MWKERSQERSQVLMDTRGGHQHPQSGPHLGCQPLGVIGLSQRPPSASGVACLLLSEASPLSDCALWTPALQGKKIVLSKINYHYAIQSGVGG